MENTLSLDPATWHVLDLIATHDRRAVNDVIRDAVLRDLHARTSGSRLNAGWLRDTLPELSLVADCAPAVPRGCRSNAA